LTGYIAFFNQIDLSNRKKLENLKTLEAQAINRPKTTLTNSMSQS